MIKDLPRVLLRKALGFITLKTIEKHRPYIVVIINDNNPSFVREFIYHLVEDKFSNK